MKAILLFLTLSVLSIPAQARMYQWVDPDSNTTQLSGKPPMWYRSAGGGPRVLVFDNGRIIDDSGIPLSGAESERLRQQALLVAEQDKQAAMQKLIQSEMLKAAMLSQQKDRADEEEITDLTQDKEPLVAEPRQAETSGPNAEELRALIDQFEQTRTQDARQLLDSSSR